VDQPLGAADSVKVTKELICAIEEMDDHLSDESVMGNFAWVRLVIVFFDPEGSGTDPLECSLEQAVKSQCISVFHKS
jgi:hypothetical protein